MNYIGSKLTLSDFIINTINEITRGFDQKVFAELFGGTGIISRKLKKRVKQCIVNDIETYSYVLLRNYIGNHKKIRTDELIERINSVKPIQGLIYKNYCLGGGTERQYFSNENGEKIDGFRTAINEWFLDNLISEDEYYFLLSSLLESADSVANTASVYAAYLKDLKRTAKESLIVKPALFDINENSHQVFSKNVNILIKEIEGDILYLDPPYNHRQYGNYYHILNTICLYDKFEPKGKTGMREYYRSEFCSRIKVYEAFDYLIKNARFKHLFVSYNNEGLMSLDDIKDIMKKYGNYELFTKEYGRYKADSNRDYTGTKTIEHLHYIEKS